MRLIDADALRGALRLYTYDGATLPPGSVAALIAAASTVQCEECASWTDKRAAANTDLRRCATWKDAYTGADVGCSFFERRQT